MACGKSTIGKRLAKLLGWSFWDTDAEIARLHGPIGQIFEREGEPAFRVYERGVVERALADPSRCVIAVGGGAPAHEPTRRLLAQGAHRVFLDVGIEQIVRRLRRARAVRPMLGTELDEEYVRALYEQRAPCYREAETIIDCSRLRVGEVARFVQEQLQVAGIVS